MKTVAQLMQKTDRPTDRPTGRGLTQYVKTAHAPDHCCSCSACDRHVAHRNAHRTGRHVCKGASAPRLKKQNTHTQCSTWKWNPREDHGSGGWRDGVAPPRASRIGGRTVRRAAPQRDTPTPSRCRLAGKTCLCCTFPPRRRPRPTPRRPGSTGTGHRLAAASRTSTCSSARTTRYLPRAAQIDACCCCTGLVWGGAFGTSI